MLARPRPLVAVGRLVGLHPRQLAEPVPGDDRANCREWHPERLGDLRAAEALLCKITVRPPWSRKKLGRIARPGHRVNGDRTTRSRRVGWEYVHVAVDDATRLANVEVLDDEKGPSAAGFLRRAVRFFCRWGIRVERVLTDNGSCYRAVVHALACRRLGIKHLRTRPTARGQTGKPSASSAPSPTAGPTAPSTPPAPNAPPRSPAGSTGTTDSDHTAHSAANHHSPGSPR